MPTSPLARARRIAVHGASGSGKTSLARRLADRIGATHVELDAIYHQPDWVALAPEEFRRRVGERVNEDAWVIDGNYQVVRDLVWARADLVVIIDRSRARTMAQLARRTLTRLVRREELWNTNRESFRGLLSRDPEENILLWSWRTHHRYHDEVPREARAALGASRVVLVRGASDLDALLDALRPG